MGFFIIIKRFSLIPIGILFIAFIISGCSGSSPRFSTVDSNTEAKEEKDEDNILVEVDRYELPANEKNEYINDDILMQFIRKRLGIPYKYGGKDERGFDCSGFAAFVYKKALKINIKPVTSEQYKLGKKISRKNLIFADLVFFNTTGRIPSHVGIYVGKDAFAHASVSKGITISSMNSEYYKKRFIGARRLIYKA